MSDSETQVYSCTQSQAIAIKRLLIELRSSQFGYQQRPIRAMLRDEYDFYVSRYRSNFTAEDFDELVRLKQILIIADSLPLVDNSCLTAQRVAKPSVQINQLNQVFVVCPSCNSQLEVDPKLQDDFLLQCPICSCKFRSQIGEKRFKHNFWVWGVIILAIAWCLGTCSTRNDANTIKRFDQRDRTEIYYRDKDGEVEGRTTIYKDGRPTEHEYYE